MGYDIFINREQTDSDGFSEKAHDSSIGNFDYLASKFQLCP